MTPLRRVIIDLVIREHYCNFDCTYCGLTQRNQDRRANSLEPGTPLRERVERIVQRARELVDAPVLKLSGGEVFLLPGFMDFLRWVHKQFEAIQVITNGSLLNPRILAEIAAMGNVQFNYSLDGHTLEMNSHRIVHGSPAGQERLANQLLENLRLVLEHRIPVEINMVLHERNAAGLLEFLAFLDGLPGPVKLYPFPVRWRPGFRMGQELYEEFRRQVEEALERYPHLLPPRTYFDHLTTFLPEYRRRRPCDLPFFVLGINDDGEILRCPCGFDHWGSIFDDEIAQRLPGNPGVGRKDYTISFCRGCFTHYEVYHSMLHDMQESTGGYDAAAYGGLLAHPAFQSAFVATAAETKELRK
jgi:MoaA/NifB/PqqE/SkfB family radical SAM enzyme